MPLIVYAILRTMCGYNDYGFVIFVCVCMHASQTCSHDTVC